MPAKSTTERQSDPPPAKSSPLDPSSFIALVPMRPHDVIGNIGCGEGDMALPLARYAYEGRIYAVDSNQKALDALAARARQYRLGNIETIAAKETSIPLADGVLDGVVVVGTLGEASRPKNIIKELHRLLRKGGWLAVLTDEKRAAEGHTKSSVELLEMALEAGLKKVTARPVNGSRYLLVLRK